MLIRGASRLMLFAESILNALGHPILVLDGAFRVLMANPAFFAAIRRTPKQTLGKDIRDVLLVEDGRAAWEHLLDNALAQPGHSGEMEIACTMAPNVRSVFLVAFRRVSAVEDQPALLLLEFRDVASEQEAERENAAERDNYEQHTLDLEVLNRELEAFTNSVSHDLRTPLRLMSKIAHLLLQQHGGELSEGAAEKVRMILQSTDEMGALVSALLSFSQINRTKLKVARVDFERLTQEVMEELRDQWAGRDVHIEVESMPPCQADRVLLKQVLMNLLENALKFTRNCAHTKVRIGYASNEAQPTYFVCDNGIGFDMNLERSMFLAFHRLGNAQQFEGSGIGLAIARSIVERHGGRIWAKSEPGEGATIYFTLSRS